MPLQPLKFKPGINREVTNYANEGGWFDCDKVRFRFGLPERIGGWIKLGLNSFVGVARALINWVALDSSNYLGVGTHLKYYIESGEVYYDITPIRATSTIDTDPFVSTLGSSDVQVTDTSHGAGDGDFVTFSGASAVGGLDLNGEHQIAYVDVDTYYVTLPSVATASATGGGAAVTAEYQLSTGLATYVTGLGWGAGSWGRSGWGSAAAFGVGLQLRLWNHGNFGEDLVFGPRGGGLFYWDASSGTTTRGVALTSLGGASDVPEVHNALLVSDRTRFVIVFGTNEIGSSVLDPMLVRWSTQENAVDWTPSATNQAGDLRLSYGSYIVTARTSKQEILVWTDAGLYSMQYQGPPLVWGFQLLGENLSLIGPNAIGIAGGVVAWMGKDKFYAYMGKVEPLPCSVEKWVFSDFNAEQSWQVCCGTNEAYSEIWWFYCSGDSLSNDRYVVFNYEENAWYYGTLSRSAWLDSPVRSSPMGASEDGKIYYHENGLDNGETDVAQPIEAFIQSADFDIAEGHTASFVNRIIPDITFVGSTSATPAVTMTLMARPAPGGDYLVTPNGTVQRSVAVPVELYTNQVWVRIRGRHMALRVESNTLGTAWQLGKPRIDSRSDGRRG
jgi:hypothetical protein